MRGRIQVGTRTGKTFTSVWDKISAEDIKALKNVGEEIGTLKELHFDTELGMVFIAGQALDYILVEVDK